MASVLAAAGVAAALAASLTALVAPIEGAHSQVEASSFEPGVAFPKRAFDAYKTEVARVASLSRSDDRKSGMSTALFERLRGTAEAHEHDEAAFRRDSENRLQVLTALRVAAYRRWHLLQGMAAAAGREATANAAAAALEFALAETGWSKSDAWYSEVRERLARPRQRSRLRAPPPARTTRRAPPMRRCRQCGNSRHGTASGSQTPFSTGSKASVDFFRSSIFERPYASTRQHRSPIASLPWLPRDLPRRWFRTAARRQSGGPGDAGLAEEQVPSRHRRVA